MLRVFLTAKEVNGFYRHERVMARNKNYEDLYELNIDVVKDKVDVSMMDFSGTDIAGDETRICIQLRKC